MLSALIHPVFLVALAFGIAKLASGAIASESELVFLAVALFNLTAGYFIHAAMTVQVARRCAQAANPWLLASLPLYWLLVSLAAWRAVWHLIVKPFQWEKTRHGLAKRATNAIIIS